MSKRNVADWAQGSEKRHHGLSLFDGRDQINEQSEEDRRKWYDLGAKDFDRWVRRFGFGQAAPGARAAAHQPAE